MGGTSNRGVAHFSIIKKGGQNLSGFIYKDQSTFDIIGRKLILCTLGAVESVTGIQRESLLGETTITRPVANEYGTKADRLQFEYFLTLDPCAETDTVPYITRDEQIEIERWLTSPKYSSDLYIINDNYDIETNYFGKFISTTWYPWGEGFGCVGFTFENTTPYPKEHREEMYSNSTNTDWTFTVDCDSDELEEYVYPIITITNLEGISAITITNLSDLSSVNSTTVTVNSEVPVIMDCRNCLFKNSISGDALTFTDVGWNDVGNIYWPRLIPGENTFSISSPASIEIKYDVVRKKVGGWLGDD